jgi:macrolide-specific efflux system membrane fusion protein
MRPGRRLVVIATILGLLVTLGAVGWHAARSARSGAIETIAVQAGDIEETVTALGRLEPRDYVDVGAQVSGLLMHLLVQPGDHVTAGQLLAEIDPQIAAAKVEADQADLARLTAELADAEAQFDYAAAEYRRQTRLRETSVGRQDTFEQARRDMRSNSAKVGKVHAQIEQAESTLKADQVQLGYTRIYAPIAGTVVSVTARQGQTINATYSTPVLMRIADLTTLTVWTEVSEADIPRLHPGMPLYFTTLGFADRRWRATLHRILPAPSRPTGQGESSDGATSGQSVPPAGGNVVFYTALFDVENPQGELRPEMSAQVFFITGVAKDVPIAPMATLMPKDPATGLYKARVMKNGEIEDRDVRIGLHTRFMAQVVSGLQLGERLANNDRADADGPSPIGFSW